MVSKVVFLQNALPECLQIFSRSNVAKIVTLLEEWYVKVKWYFWGHTIEFKNIVSRPSDEEKPVQSQDWDMKWKSMPQYDEQPSEIFSFHTYG